MVTCNHNKLCLDQREMSGFLNDTNDLGSFNLSDISDVDPDEIEKIIKSASEIDKKYIGFETSVPKEESSKFPVAELPRTQSRVNQLSDVNRRESGLASLQFGKEVPLSSEDTLDKPSVSDLKFNEESRKRNQKNLRGSGDWLGLKDSPERNETSKELKGRTVDGGEMFLGQREKSGEGRKPSARKDRLLDELFGDIKVPPDPSVAEDESKSYLPSEPRLSRTGQSKTADASFLSSEPKLARPTTASYLPSEVRSAKTEETNYLFSEPRVPKSAESSQQPSEPSLPEHPPSSGYLPSSVRVGGGRRPSSARTNVDVMQEMIPNEALIPASDSALKKKIEPPVQQILGSGLPEWLGGGKTEKKEEVLQIDRREPAQTGAAPTQTLSQTSSSLGGSETLLTLLTRFQKELGSALTKRNENLQNCLKVLLNEAERVFGVEEILLNNQESTTKKENKITEASANKKEEKLVKEEDETMNFQITLKDLDLQNNRLKLEIENLKSVHEMELDTIQKNHSYEISSLEARHERMKSSFEEIEVEYKEKIAKLKESEVDLINQHKMKLEKAEQLRLAELETLGELHQAALHQAAALSISTNSSGKMVRIPLISSNSRPKDEVELSERESSLLEKEKQLEVLRGIVEGEREELEMARAEHEERERDLRQKAREARLQEEARQAQATRERDQLQALAQQIKEMQDIAVREQGEIAKEKFELAAERARLEAIYTIEGRTDNTIPPLDIMQARVEVEAALEMAKEAKVAAEHERRQHAEKRQTIEQISWEQKEADLRLDNRERHLMKMLENAEKIRNEGLNALEECKKLKNETEQKEAELQDQVKRLEAQERILTKERFEIAKEKIELERRRSQLDVFLPEFYTSDEMSLKVPRTCGLECLHVPDYLNSGETDKCQESASELILAFVDPKALILRLKAEREFE